LDIIQNDRVLESGKSDEEMERDRRLFESGQAVPCGLCQRLVGLDQMIQVPERGWVCRRCVDAVIAARDAATPGVRR
jgi:hypothetical protein